MKLSKPLLCATVLTATGAAQAGTLALNDLYGILAAVNVVGMTTDPVLVVGPGQPSFALRNLSLTYTGSNMDDADFAITGLRGVMDLTPVFIAYDAPVAGRATVTQPHAVYEIGEIGTVSWDAATRTVTLGQPLYYTDAKDSDMGGRTGVLTQTYANQSSDAVAKWSVANGAVSGTCAGSGTICDAQNRHFLGKPDIERFYLTLTFDESGSYITGRAVGLDVGGKVPLGETGNVLTLYTLETPIPAAAWLFGSALVGLGAARRRG